MSTFTDPSHAQAVIWEAIRRPIADILNPRAIVPSAAEKGWVTRRRKQRAGDPVLVEAVS